MIHNDLDRLYSFHSGNLDTQSRLDVEQELLLDPEKLIEYFDRKREWEKAKPVPQAPSARVYQRLFSQLSPRKKQFLIWTLGAAFAACLVGTLAFQMIQTSKSQTPTLLFDSGSELPMSSSVL